MENIDSKEVAVVRQQATKALTAANEIAINKVDDLTKATDVLSKIKSVGKMIKQRKEKITRPLMESLSSVRDLFKPIEQSHAEAERIIKGKMLVFQENEERAQAEAKQKLVERVERGTMKAETAIDKIEDMQDVPTAAKGKVGSISTRTIKKVRIVDELKLPREYLSPNMPKINEDALKKSVEIPGVEVYSEKVIAAK